MELRTWILGLLIALVLTGCGSTWVNLDSSKASNEKIKAAEVSCQVVEKTRQLQTKEMAIDLMKLNAETDEAKEELDEVYRNSEETFITEINECMRKQGLSRNQ